jgi:carbonic anhydrase
MRRKFVVAVLLTLAAVVAVAQEAAESSNCPPRYAYCGWSGPQQWANIPGSHCGGTKQSPVDIRNWQTVGSGPEIAVNYSDGAATVLNTGHDIHVTPAGTNNSITIDGKTWPLAQFHFHTPSEHHLRGRTYPGEVHFVHQVGDLIAVIAVLLPVDGKGNRFLAPIFESLPGNVCASSTINLQLSELLPDTIRSYYTYEGSLTTPMCDEVVTFYIANGTSLVLSPSQRTNLQRLGANARPLQNINGRPITLVQPR